MFWENFLANFLSSVTAGIVLGLLGIGVYQKFYKKTINKQSVGQENKYGSNVNIIGKQTNNNYVSKETKKITEKY